MRMTALRVAIIGGGIGGVAAANALLQRGMDVRVYEQASALSEVGAGHALQPNGLRMLRRLGCGHDLPVGAVRPGAAARLDPGAPDAAR